MTCPVCVLYHHHVSLMAIITHLGSQIYLIILIVFGIWWKSPEIYDQSKLKQLCAKINTFPRSVFNIGHISSVFQMTFDTLHIKTFHSHLHICFYVSPSLRSLSTQYNACNMWVKTFFLAYSHQSGVWQQSDTYHHVIMCLILFLQKPFSPALVLVIVCHLLDLADILLN